MEVQEQAAGLPPLPSELQELQRILAADLQARHDACRRLRRSMAKAEQAGAGRLDLPPTDPAAQAAHLGLPWPRMGGRRCFKCAVCIQGGCRKQGLDECQGCRTSRTCERLKCVEPYIPLRPQQVSASSASSGAISSEILAERARALRAAGQTYRETLGTLTNSLRNLGLDSREVSSRSIEAMEQDRAAFLDEEEVLQEQAAAQVLTLRRDESLHDDGSSRQPPASEEAATASLSTSSYSGRQQRSPPEAPSLQPPRY